MADDYLNGVLVAPVALAAFAAGFGACLLLRGGSQARPSSAAGAGLEGTETTRQATDAGKDAPRKQASEVTEKECKMVLVVRTDLKMTKGKACAQCCHACLGAYQAAVERWPAFVEAWESDGGVAKVSLKVESEEELLSIYRAAKQANLPCYCVQDAGRTQIAAGSRTVVGIGPAPIDLIDSVTGELKLF